MWHFSPMEPVYYELKSALHSCLCVPSKSHVKTKSVLEILGTGATGIIKVHINIM